MEPSSAPSNPGKEESPETPARSRGRAGLVLGAVALCLIVVLGFWLVTSLRRLNRQMAQLSRQTEQFNRRVEGAEQQSQSLAQQASQAAANAQAAAQQRDEAKQSEANAAAQAQAALDAAAAAQLQADQAEQKAEEYRKQREEELQELQQLQQVLGQIAETHRTTLGLVMTLGEKSIRFDFDKASIEPQYRDILNRIAGVLMTLKGYSIYVYGYTDDVGTQDYNLKLSARRAQAVRDSLVQAGINPGLISTKGFGKSDPRVKDDSAEARAANRRVEIGIVDSRLLFEPLPEK